MRGWILVFYSLVAVTAAGLLYLTSRFKKFIPEKIIQRIGKFKAWLLASLPLVPVVLYAYFDRINAAIIVVNVFFIWLLSDVAAFIFRKLFIKKKTPYKENYKENHIYVSGICALVFSVFYLSAGYYFAHRVKQTDYVVKTSKDTGFDSFRIALIADSHIGSTFDGEGFSIHLKKIQESSPDILVIAGDFVDDDSCRTDLETACRALCEFNAPYGIYFVYGNHDKGYFRNRDFSAEELHETLERYGVRILEDEAVSAGGNIILAGRKDYSEVLKGYGRSSVSELVNPLDKSKFIIVLDHQPHEYKDEADAGVDLVLSGHTHGGQMFPGALFSNLSGANDSAYGLSKTGDTAFIVTSGISDWAINFKTGTSSEFCIIDVKR